MKKKFLVLSLALVLTIPAVTSAKKNKNKNTNNDNNASYSIASVSPSTVENYADTNITITGVGFSAITTVGAKLGQWEDNTQDDTDDSFPLTNVVVANDTTITATVPTGAEAEDDEDLTVYDSGVTPNTHYTLNDAITVHPSFQVNDEDGDNDGIVEVFQSSSSSAKAVFSLTVLGKTFKNKRWLKLRVGDKKAVITKVSRTGDNTIVRAKFKYGKMVADFYDISLTYKDRLKKGVVRKGKVKYNNLWERGTMTASNAFNVMLQPIQ